MLNDSERDSLPRSRFFSTSLSSLVLSASFTTRVWLTWSGVSGSGGRGSPTVLGKEYTAPVSGQSISEFVPAMTKKIVPANPIATTPKDSNPIFALPTRSVLGIGILRYDMNHSCGTLNFGSRADGIENVRGPNLKFTLYFPPWQICLLLLLVLPSLVWQRWHMLPRLYPNAELLMPGYLSSATQ